MNTDSMEVLVKKILEEMNTTTEPEKTSVAETKSHSSLGTASVADYPIAQKHPEWVKSETGKTLDDITLENVLSGKIVDKDLRITPAILRAQGEIATSAGRPTIENNFGRAAELTAIPDERVLEMYNALRPYRSSKTELEEIANELEQTYQATVTAAYVREAAYFYEIRKKLKGDN